MGNQQNGLQNCVKSRLEAMLSWQNLIWAVGTFQHQIGTDTSVKRPTISHLSWTSWDLVRSHPRPPRVLKPVTMLNPKALSLLHLFMECTNTKMLNRSCTSILIVKHSVEHVKK